MRAPRAPKEKSSIKKGRSVRACGPHSAVHDAGADRIAPPPHSITSAPPLYSTASTPPPHRTALVLHRDRIRAAASNLPSLLTRFARSSLASSGGSAVAARHRRAAVSGSPAPAPPGCKRELRSRPAHAATGAAWRAAAPQFSCQMGRLCRAHRRARPIARVRRRRPAGVASGPVRQVRHAVASRTSGRRRRGRR